MALTHCNECKHQISDNATTCPHCGAPTQAKHDSDTIVGLLIMGGGVLLFWWMANMGLFPDSWMQWMLENGILTR
jgi:hypothetical protein